MRTHTLTLLTVNKLNNFEMRYKHLGSPMLCCLEYLYSAKRNCQFLQSETHKSNAKTKTKTEDENRKCETNSNVQSDEGANKRNVSSVIT